MLAAENTAQERMLQAGLTRGVALGVCGAPSDAMRLGLTNLQLPPYK